MSWNIEPFNRSNKSHRIDGPDDIRLDLDTDDVPAEEVYEQAKIMVAILNLIWPVVKIPDAYVFHGFVHDVFDEFAYEGTEWGDAIRALLQSYNDGDVWGDEERWQMALMLKEQFEMAHGGWLAQEYPDEFKRARERYKDLYEYWHRRSLSFHAEESLMLAVAFLPDFMKEDGK